MWQEITELFTEMGWVSGILLSLGIIFAVIEFFTPGLGISGAVSAICVVCGIIARMVEGGSFTQLFIMIFLVLIIFTILFLLTVRSAKYGVLSKSPFVETGTAVSTELRDEEKNPLKALIGKQGVASSALRPVGMAKIEDQTYEVMANVGFLDADTKIEVIRVEGNKVFVKAIEEDNATEKTNENAKESVDTKENAKEKENVTEE